MRMQEQPTFRPGAAPPSLGLSSHDGKLVKRQVQRTPRNVLIGIGAVLLLMLCVVPVWNSILLMKDDNYVFWAGQWTPTSIIIFSAWVFVLYIATIWIFFGYSGNEAQTEQTVMMIATIFITLLGLGFMLVSLPLCRQARHTYTNLMHRCDYSSDTHRIYEVSKVLHNIRRAPGCTDKYSVEECNGYQEVQPYTQYLKVMENSFRCSGFCYSRPAAGALPADAAPLTEAVAPTASTGDSGSSPAGEAAAAAQSTTAMTTSAAQVDSPPAAVPREAGQVQRHHHELPVMAFGLLQAGEASGAASRAPVDVLDPATRYPPTLFSDANYQASCEGMAARSMINFAGDVGLQTFYQGIYLVLISISMGVLKLVTYCSRGGGKK